MRGFDLSPLFRSAIGFDRTSRLLDAALEQLGDSVPAYPPYNIARRDANEYRITMAVAGFGEDDLEITVTDNELVIKGARGVEDSNKKLLHRGIASRAFERSFQLAEYIVVSGAKLENGLLEIGLARELPEAMKPRKIAIGTGKPKRLTAKAA